MIRRVSAATLILIFVTGVLQAGADPVGVLSGSSGSSADGQRPLQQSIAKMQMQMKMQMQAEPLTATRASQLFGPRPRPQGTAKQRAFAMVGAMLGLLGGGFLGAAIEGDRCHCDDPGLSGFVIGAPIGMIAGGVIGYKLGK